MKKPKRTKTRSRLGHLSQVEMTLKDLKREVIIRGLPFEEVVEKDIPGLYAWWNRNQNNEIDESLLDGFDDWVDENLRAIGREDLIHDTFRFNYLGNKALEDKTEKPKKRKEVKIKKPRKKNSLGLVAGTKKAMVYEAYHKGWSLKKTTRKVTRAFPDALEKSIKIWYNQARRKAEKNG